MSSISSNNNNSSGHAAALPKTASTQADEAFLRSLSPEIIAEQARIMKQIEQEKAKGGRMAGTQNIERQQLSIRHAVFC
jgi:hypothetical protein